MATFVNASTVVSASSGNVTPTLPSGWAVNDILLCIFASLDTVVSTMPAGWTVVSGLPADSGNNTRLYVFWRRAVAGDTDPTITHAAGGAIAATIVAYRGAITGATPMEVVGTPVGTAGNTSTTLTFGSLTPLSTATLVIECGAIGGSRTTSSYSGSPTPTKEFEAPATTNFPTLVVADFPLSSVIATGTRTATISSGRNNVGILFALTPMQTATESAPSAESVAATAVVPASESAPSAETVTASATAASSEAAPSGETFTTTVAASNDESAPGGESVAAAADVPASESAPSAEAVTVAATTAISEAAPSGETFTPGVIDSISESAPSAESTAVSTSDGVSESAPRAEAISVREIIPDLTEVIELVKVSWPAPDGDVYYVSTADEYLLRGLSALLPRANVEIRLPGRAFQEILTDAILADDQVRLRFWDADNKLSDLAAVHGAGQRTEIFHWFPQRSLLLPVWLGHLQPVSEGTVDWYECTAEVGFRSSMLPLPRRGFYNSCSALFGGWLKTQQEIDEGDCPYNRHLTQGTLDGFTPADAQNVDTSSGVIKNAGGNAWNAGARHDTAIQEGEDAVIVVTRGAPYAAFGFAATPLIRSYTDFRAAIQWNPDGTLTFQCNEGTAQRWPIAKSVSGDELRLELRAGRFRLYDASGELTPSAVGFTMPAPSYPLYMGVAIQNEGSGVSAVSVKIGEIGASAGRGNLDPATSQPFTTCARTRPHCIARLGDDLSYLGFDTVIQSYTEGEGGSKITVTTRGNESNLKRPQRVVFGERDVQDLDLMAYTVEPDTKHPEGGAVTVLFDECEGPIEGANKQSVNGVEVGFAHLNQRNGENRQARTGFSPAVSNYSGTGLFFGRVQGDYTKTSPDQLRGSAHIFGLRNVRRYIAETNFIEEYSKDRAWCLLRCLTDKRWGMGYDPVRFEIEEDWIPLSLWGKQQVTFIGADGQQYTGQRTDFNAELIDRTAQQQIADICRSGRYSLPFVEAGKLRIKPLSLDPAFFSPSAFTRAAYVGALGRNPTTDEESGWVTALGATDIASLWAEASARVNSLFAGSEYAALAHSDDEFVDDCYRAFLNREAEPEGKTFWVDNTTANGRADTLARFDASGDFRGRLTVQEAPLFTDRGTARNIVWQNGRSTLRRQELGDAEIPNRILLTYDDADHKSAEQPLIFEGENGIDAQLRAGRAFGDTTRRAVEKQYTAFGVTSLGEALRLGNLLKDLGEFDEGGLENNLRFTFTGWIMDCRALRKYSLVRIESDKLDRLNDHRADQGLERFTYFRIRTMRRLPNLQVEISVQAYPIEYYQRLESVSVPAPVISPGGLDNPGGDRLTPPTRLTVLPGSIITENDRILFRLTGNIL